MEDKVDQEETENENVLIDVCPHCNQTPWLEGHMVGCPIMDKEA